MNFTVVTLLALASTAVAASDMTAYAKRAHLHNHAEERDGPVDLVGKSQHNSDRRLDGVLYDVNTLGRRACNPTACSCKYVLAGLFCGDGLLGCKKGYVYQCSGGPKSCEFGLRDSCKQCNQLQC
ncbi:hypothetical protein CcaverHIS002_0700860 [Cutaneotrichosporon cavernicola]|nr:hypothetical protein CcaverHIS002_0700860 [Cutaneotrichosporon cavernicola]BEJ10050.1 hypothetical protein CcaverHIS641_0700850 [Cutaneotrichosporon cavernicola]